MRKNMQKLALLLFAAQCEKRGERLACRTQLLRNRCLENCLTTGRKAGEK